MKNIERVLEFLREKEVEYKLAKHKRFKARVLFNELERKIETYEKIKRIIYLVSEKTQREIKGYIESTVTEALQIVFGTSYKFVLEIEEKNDQQEVHFFIEQDGELLDPKEEMVSGGMLDICSMALRFAVWSVEDSPESIFLLDEPIKNARFHAQPELIPEMVRYECDALDLQMIIVSHEKGIRDIADNVIDLGSSGEEGE